MVRYRCKICGRKKFTRPTAHNCVGGYLKRYGRQARLRGWDSIFEEVELMWYVFHDPNNMKYKAKFGEVCDSEYDTFDQANNRCIELNKPLTNRRM